MGRWKGWMSFELQASWAPLAFETLCALQRRSTTPHRESLQATQWQLPFRLGWHLRSNCQLQAPRAVLGCAELRQETSKLHEIPGCVLRRLPYYNVIGLILVRIPGNTAQATSSFAYVRRSTRLKCYRSHRTAQQAEKCWNKKKWHKHFNPD